MALPSEWIQDAARAANAHNTQPWEIEALHDQLILSSTPGRTLGPSDPAWSAVLWSVKESLFKAWFALAGTRLDLSEFAVRLAPDEHSFTALVLPKPAAVVLGRESPPRLFGGRWAVCSDHVLTAVVCRYDRHP